MILKKSIIWIYLLTVVTKLEALVTGYSKINLIYNSDLNLTCAQNTNVKFYMTNIYTNYTKLINYDNRKYIFNSIKNMLTIKSLKKNDMIHSYYCNSSFGLEIYFVSQIQPYLYKVEELTLTVLEDYPAQLSCYLLIGNEYDQNITWTWWFKNETISPNCLTTIVSNNTATTLRFNSTTLLNKGYYKCKASNEYGSFSREVSLRIKSRFAALWPFLGFVLEVIALSAIIIYNNLKKKKEESDLDKTE